MITTTDLKSHTKADLAKMAKRLGVAGCSGMRKDELVKAVAKASKAQAKKSPKAKTARPKAKAASRTTVKAASKKIANGTARAAKATSKSPTKTQNGKPQNGKPSKVTTKANGSTRGKSAATKTASSPARKASKSRIGVPKKLAEPAARTKKTTTAKATSKPKAASKSTSKSRAKSTAKPTSPRVLKRIRELQLQKESNKDVSFQPTLIKPPGASEPIWEKEPDSDRVALFVRDAYWMHASWDITRSAVERAKAALAEHWHTAHPILRLLRMDESGTTAETVEREIPIHGGLRDWYIDWNGEPATFRVMVGYTAGQDRFHCICESNVVTTPGAGSKDDVDEHWGDLGGDAEHVFALSGGYDGERETADLQDLLESRLQRELGAPALAKLGAAAQSPFKRRNDFHFEMDVELVVYGATLPDAYLTLNGEPVTLRDDGTFAMRLPFPDRRQVLPAVACSRDGSQERMIVIAVERNTKIMEPLQKDRTASE